MQKTLAPLPYGRGVAARKKSTSAPVLRPIQSLCSFLMLGDQSTISRSFSSRSAYAVIRSIHCRSGMRTTGCPPRSLTPPMHFFVRQHRAQRRAPVHRRFVLIGQPMRVLILPHGRFALLLHFGRNRQLADRPAAALMRSPGGILPRLAGVEPGIEQHQKNPLRPSEIVRIGRRQFAVPVVAEAEHLELPRERGDVLFGVTRAAARLCGSLLLRPAGRRRRSPSGA